MSDVTFREWLTVIILCFVNLINYMDRLTLAGILKDIQEYYKIGDDKGGLLQTAFILSYMIFAPVFGYMGDRYSRRYIMAFGIFLWSLTTLLGSFMTSFGLFVLFRALVGIGEASYSTVAPTIIGDLFVNHIRSKMLALFYFAIPVGSGLGYIVGSETAKMAGSWQWGLRVTPFLGAIGVSLILCVLQEPRRGQSKGGGHLSSTSLMEDVKNIVKNRSFMLTTAGFTCVAFVAGAMTWWGPTFIHLGIQLQPSGKHITLNDLSLTFGAITMVAGIVGLTLGCLLSQWLIEKYPGVDPIICGLGLLTSSPLLLGSTFASTSNSIICYFLLFFGQVTLNLNWAIVTDITLYVVLPTRRSTAEGFQMLISHALGDAGSPYLIGVISESLKLLLNPNATAVTNNWNITTAPSAALTAVANHTNYGDYVKFKAIQYALFVTCFVEMLGGFFFLATAFFIKQDRLKVDKAVKGIPPSAPGTQTNVEVSDI